MIISSKMQRFKQNQRLMTDLQKDVLYFTPGRALQVLLDPHNLGIISQAVLKHITLLLGEAQLAKAGTGLCECPLLGI